MLGPPSNVTSTDAPIFDSATCVNLEAKIAMYFSALAGGGQRLAKWHLRSLERYAEECPHDREGLTEVGQLYFEKENYAKAIHYFGRALFVSPHDESIMEALSLALMNAERIDEAVNLYGVFLRSFPANTKSVIRYYKDLGQDSIVRRVLDQLSPDYLPERKNAHMNAVVNNQGLVAVNHKK